MTLAFGKSKERRRNRPRESLLKATVRTEKLENINDVFARMHKGQIQGRVVLDMAA